MKKEMNVNSKKPKAVFIYSRTYPFFKT